MIDTKHPIKGGLTGFTDVFVQILLYCRLSCRGVIQQADS